MRYIRLAFSELHPIGWPRQRRPTARHWIRRRFHTVRQHDSLERARGAIARDERAVSCEEVFEFRLAARDWVALQCRQPSLEGTGKVSLRRLVKGAPRAGGPGGSSSGRSARPKRWTRRWL